MLARLDEIPGVDASRVDRSGRHFVLALERGADENAISARARAELGDRSRVLSGRAESEILESYRRGDPWLDSEETVALSREEARVLALRFGEEAAVEIGLSPEKSRKLAEVIEKELALAFANVHGSESALRDLSAELQKMSGRILESARAFLTDEELQGLRAFAIARMQEREEAAAPECEPPPDGPSEEDS